MMDLIIYHNACPDGWCAAFIAKMKYPEAKLLPLNHGLNEEQLEEVFVQADNKDVLMVDYSLRTRELNDKLAFLAKFFRILDHHKSAQQVLDGASYATFDMKRSGAGLAWDYLFGFDSDLDKRYPIESKREYIHEHSHYAMSRPWWVNYTEDQDLWNWALPNSQEINAYLMTQPRTVDTWNSIIKISEKDATYWGYGSRQYIEYYTRSVVDELQEGVLVFEGRNYRTAVLNIPYAGVSEAGAALVEKGYEIGLAWFERGDGITQFSIRTKKGDDVDASKIARSFGGGGHQSAAGFQVSIKEGRELVDWILGRNNYEPSPRCC